MANHEVNYMPEVGYDVKTGPETTFRPRVLNKPHYQELRVVSEQGTASFDLDTTSWITRNYRFRSPCFRLKDLVLRSHVAVGTTAANKVNCLHLGVPIVDTIRIMDSQRGVLLEERYLARRFNTACALSMSMEEFKNSYAGTYTQALVNKNTSFETNGLFPNRVLGSADLNGTARISSQRISYQGKPTNESLPYTEQAHFYVSADDAGTSESLIHWASELKFKDLKGTGLALDKMLYVGDRTIIVQVEYVQGQDISWTADDFGAGDADHIDENPAAPSTITISNDELIVKECISPSVLSALKSQYDSNGISYIVPETRVMPVSVPSASSFDVEVDIYSSAGSKNLLRVYHMFYIPGNYNANHNLTCVNARKIKRFQTFLDDKPLQRREMYVGTDDWRYMKEMLEGSMIQGQNHWLHKRVFVDDFTGLKSIDWDAHMSDVSGIPIGSSKKYKIEVKDAEESAYVCYVVAVMQKNITFSALEINMGQPLLPQ